MLEIDNVQLGSKSHLDRITRVEAMGIDNHAARLRDGVEQWNRWRSDNPEIVPVLCEEDLVRAQLRGADLRHADLSNAALRGANLRDADLRHANLHGANLRGAYLRKTDLTSASLTSCNLVGANLIGAKLVDTDLDAAICWDTFFVAVDLSKTRGLAACHHRGPSVVDRRTMAVSGALPENFLKGCGLSDWEMELSHLFAQDLDSAKISTIVRRAHELRRKGVVQYRSLFISYSHADSDFVECIAAKLDSVGLAYWRDVQDAPAGPLENIVSRAIEQNPVVLLVLSRNSVASDWVEFEALEARRVEKNLQRSILCPVRLDDAWEESPWSAVLRSQIKKYNVLDFSDWRDPIRLDQQFGRLLEGLDLFYGTSPD